MSRKWDPAWRDYRPPGDFTPAGNPGRPVSARVNKFAAEKTTAADGVVLDSGHEARVYQDLQLRVAAGEITDLRRQVRINLDVNGQRICWIKVDFVYRDRATGQLVHAEAKSPVTRTRQYVITRRLLTALTGIVVEEV